MKRVFAAVLLSLLSVRCATVAHGRSQRIHVTSSPTGAQVRVACGVDPARDAGVTPLDVVVRRGAESCRITMSKSGFADRTVALTRMHSNMTWSNLVPGFALGLVAGAGVAVLSIWNDNSSGGNEGNAAFGAGLAAGTGIGLLIDKGTGGWYKQVPERIEATLDPRP